MIHSNARGTSVGGSASSTTASAWHEAEDNPYKRGNTVRLKIAASTIRPSDEFESLFQPALPREYSIVEVSVNHPVWGTSDQYATALGFFPLALGPLLLCLGFLGWGGSNVILPIAEGHFSWDKTGDVIVGVFLVILSSIGVAGIVGRWNSGLHILGIGYNVFMISQAVSFVTKWLEWGLAMGGVTTEDGAKWVPIRSDMVYMIVYSTGIIVLILVSLLFIIGWLKSLKMIITAGGHGWERQNYIEILQSKQAQLENAHAHHSNNNSNSRQQLNNHNADHQPPTNQNNSFSSRDDYSFTFEPRPSH